MQLRSYPGPYRRPRSTRLALSRRVELSRVHVESARERLRAASASERDDAQRDLTHAEATLQLRRRQRDDLRLAATVAAVRAGLAFRPSRGRPRRRPQELIDEARSLARIAGRRSDYFYVLEERRGFPPGRAESIRKTAVARGLLARGPRARTLGLTAAGWELAAESFAEHGLSEAQLEWARATAEQFQRMSEAGDFEGAIGLAREIELEEMARDLR